MAFRWGLRVRHRLQPLGLYGLVDIAGGLGAGLDGDRGRGVPRRRVGLWGLDGWALGDKDVDEGLNGVVLCGRLRGGGSRWGEGGSGISGRMVLALFWVRVWVRTGPLLLPLRVLCFLALFVVVWVLFVKLLVVVVVVVLLRVLLSFGFRFWFGVRFWGWGPARG